MKLIDRREIDYKRFIALKKEGKCYCNMGHYWYMLTKTKITVV